MAAPDSLSARVWTGLQPLEEPDQPPTSPYGEDTVGVEAALFQPLPGQGLDLGRRPVALANTAIQGRVVEGGGSQAGRYSVLRSADQTYRFFGIDANVAASSPLATVQDALSLIQQMQLRQNDVSIVAWAENSVTKVLHFDEPRPDAKFLDKARGTHFMDDFQRMYGTHYVGGIRVGVRYVSMFRFRDVERNDQQRILNALHAEGIGPGGGASADLGIAINNVRRQFQSGTAFDYRVTGNVQTTPPADPAQMLAYLQNFSNVPVTGRACLEYETRPYSRAGIRYVVS